MANKIFVINKNGYIGSSTKSEIEYAIKKAKKLIIWKIIKNNNI